MQHEDAGRVVVRPVRIDGAGHRRGHRGVGRGGLQRMHHADVETPPIGSSMLPDTINFCIGSLRARTIRWLPALRLPNAVGSMPIADNPGASASQNNRAASVGLLRRDCRNSVRPARSSSSVMAEAVSRNPCRAPSTCRATVFGQAPVFGVRDAEQQHAVRIERLRMAAQQRPGSRARCRMSS